MTPLKTSFASLSEYCWECHVNHRLLHRSSPRTTMMSL